jgi:Putative auto-transporter adhesin, head GIN domain
MKKIINLTFILLSLCSFSQKQEKIKASKIVTISQKELISFKELELWNNLDVILIKGTTCNLEIEADDNLHETFIVKNAGKKLIISNNSRISGAKKMILKLTYSDSLQAMYLKDDVKITSLEDISNENFSISTYNDSKLKIGIKNKNTILNCNDNSKLELVINSDDFTLNTFNDSKFEGSISCKKANISLINDSKVKLEGSTEDLILSSKDSSDYKGKNFISSNANVNGKGKSSIEINCKNKLTINAVNSTKIELFGTPKIEIETFDGEAILQKRGFRN